jgi:hypothetical protein
MLSGFRFDQTKQEKNQTCPVLVSVLYPGFAFGFHLKTQN